MSKMDALQIKYGDTFAGLLMRTPDGGTRFQYDPSYLANTDAKPISRTLPMRREPFEHSFGLIPFFDNLVAEGWLQGAQARYLGIRPDDRFGLLSHFGFDCSGAVWIDKTETSKNDSFVSQIPDDIPDAEIWLAAQSSHASLSGVQPKLLIRKDKSRFRPVHPYELSTHIAKLESPEGHPADIIEIEFLTTEAMRTLLNRDEIVEMQIANIQLPFEGAIIERKALVVKRFDRRRDRRLHFEELNQLLNLSSRQKYDGTYCGLCDYMRNERDIVPAEVEKFVRRILACVLLGNTDAHMKNFALFDVGGTRSLTPVYDMVAGVLYPQYGQMALAFKDGNPPQLRGIKPRHIIDFVDQAGLSQKHLNLIISDLETRLDATYERIASTQNVHQSIKDKLTEVIERRWNGTFKSIGAYLLKKPASGG